VVIHHDADILPFRLDLRDFFCVGVSCYSAVAVFIMSDVVFGDAGRDQVELALMPNPLPSVEKITLKKANAST
jgi:hypothetical protein